MQWKSFKVETEEIQLSPPPFPQVYFLPTAIWNWTPQPPSRGGEIHGLHLPLEDLTMQSEQTCTQKHKAGKERENVEEPSASNFYGLHAKTTLSTPVAG